MYEVVAEPWEPLEQAQQVERRENQAQGPVDPGAEQQTQGKPRCTTTSYTTSSAAAATRMHMI